MVKDGLKSVISIIVLTSIYSCAPSLKYTPITPSRTPKPNTYNIIVYNQGDKLPSNSTVLGTIYVGDTGVSVNCGYDDVVNCVKEKARAVGADAIQIIKVQTPDLSSSCYRITARLIAIEDISDWPKIRMTEMDFRNYYDVNVNGLNQIEGIWNVSETRAWRDLLFGTRTIDNSNVYRIAIIKDSTNSNFDFSAVILESKYSEWKPGYVKARFRKTAYESIYDGIWFLSNFTEEKNNYVINEKGVMKTKFIQTSGNIDVRVEMAFIEAYPPYFRKSTSSSTLTSNVRSVGSGFLLSKNGLVITNYHVIVDAQKVEILFPGKNFIKEGFLKIKDLNNDIAILAIKNFDLTEICNYEIPYSLTDINSVKIGQEVFTLGFPLGSIMGSNARLSTGRINSIFGIQDDPRLFQISNPLQPGNSGGPLFNMKGELVGIVVSGLNAKFFYENLGIIPQNVNFAVKISYLKNLIGMLPDVQEIIKRKSELHDLSIEEQIEKLDPFVVQIKAY